MNVKRNIRDVHIIKLVNLKKNEHRIIVNGKRTTILGIQIVGLRKRSKTKIIPG